MKRRPWVFELRDLWPETIKTVGAMSDSSAIRALERLELFLYRRADAIVSVTRSFKRVLESRGVDPSKIHVITNGVDFSQFSPRPKDKDLVRELGVGGRFVVGYVGTHGMCQALETVVEAAGLINDERVVFVLLGDGARKQALRDAAAAKGVTNILFVDTVSKSEVPAFWSVLDVSLTHLQRTPLFQTVIPSKLFESMGMGIPILHGVDGESAEIVRDCGVGEVFRSEDSRDLADRVMRLANAPEALQSFRENCAKSAKQFDRSELALRMLRVLEETVATCQVQSPR
jgi:hypothetical protein